LEKNGVSEQLKSYGEYDENHRYIKLWEGEEWVEYEEWVMDKGWVPDDRWLGYEEWEE
jgi:hypothetical protein